MSKASHSDELLTQINYADINCEIFTFQWHPRERDDYVEERLRILIKGIGDYLTRVVGSVPVDLKITLQVYCDATSGVPFGPFYYEGEGQARSEYEEEG